MPFSDQSYTAPLGETWRSYLRTFLDNLETAANGAKTRADDAYTLAQAKYSKPAGGIPVTDLVTSGLVQTDGTVLRAVVMTQAAYDALGTKVATTLYVISG